MKTQKTFSLNIALIIAAMLFLTINISAQQRQGGGPPPMPDESQIVEMVEELSAELSLTETQETEILALYQDHFDDVKSTMSSGQRPDRNKMESLKEEFENDVKSLLTDEQQELFDEYQEKNQKKGNGGQRGRR